MITKYPTRIEATQAAKSSPRPCTLSPSDPANRAGPWIVDTLDAPDPARPRIYPILDEKES